MFLSLSSECGEMSWELEAEDPSAPQETPLWYSGGRSGGGAREGHVQGLTREPSTLNISLYGHTWVVSEVFLAC